MADIEHRTLGNQDTKTHGIIKRTVANAAALVAEVITADDIAQKIVIRQLDTDQLWVPTSTTPTFELVTGYSIGIRESGGTNLSIGAISNQSLIARVGTAIVSAALGTGLAFAGGTLSLNPVSNTDQGVVPAVGAAGTVPISNGSAAVWGNDFAAQNLITSGRYIATTLSNAINIGSPLPTTGSIRVAHGFTIVGRNNGNTADRTLFDWGVTANDNLHIANSSVTVINNATSSGIGWIIRLGGTNRLTLSTSQLSLGVQKYAWESTVASPIIQQDNVTTNGAIGQTLLINGQNATGTTSTGGGIDIVPGTGTSAGGAVRLRTSGLTTRLSYNDTGLGLYAKTPVAQAARVGQGTNNTGVVAVNRTMSDVNTAGIADPAKINLNFANLIDNMWNPLELAITNLGVTA